MAGNDHGWLDPRLATSSVFLADLALCQARLQSDARWPWIVLIPRRADLKELEHLSTGDLSQLMAEVLAAGRAVRALGIERGRPVEKLNTGALGNIVSQLHVHVVGRCSDDPAWPGPVWGHGVAEPYTPDQLEVAVALVRAGLAEAI